MLTRRKHKHIHGCIERMEIWECRNQTNAGLREVFAYCDLCNQIPNESFLSAFSDDREADFRQICDGLDEDVNAFVLSEARDAANMFPSPVCGRGGLRGECVFNSVRDCNYPRSIPTEIEVDLSAQLRNHNGCNSIAQPQQILEPRIFGEPIAHAIVLYPKCFDAFAYGNGRQQNFFRKAEHAESIQIGKLLQKNFQEDR